MADYYVAEYYAAYAKRGCESIVMVVLTIAKQVIDDLEEPNILRLYWEPRWKPLKAAEVPKPAATQILQRTPHHRPYFQGRGGEVQGDGVVGISDRWLCASHPVVWWE